MKKTSLLFLIGLIFSFLCLFFWVPSNAKSNQETVTLFSLIGTEKLVAGDKAQSSASIAGVREQQIGINFDGIDFETAQNLNFPLLDGKSYQAIRRDFEGFVRFADGGVTWRGKIFGDNDWSGDVILTMKGRALSGLIYSPEGVYEIVPQANFAHLLVQIDQSLFPSCGGAIPPKLESEITEANPTSLGDEQIGSDDGSQIDVMIVYTAPVRSALGGTTQAQAFAQQAVSTTNTVYQNSGIATRLRLVQTMEVSYADNGDGRAGLDWVTSDATVAAARNTAKADMVALLTENANDLCGIAWIMTSVGPAFESRAFSLIQRTCAIAGLTFPHELGHNQACDHNPENANAASDLAYPYAFGHWNSSASFRTVMSYSNPCPSCSRIAYFSNPSITYNGVPIGITNQRDNTRVINNTALTISRFRDSGGGTNPTKAQITSPSNGSTLSSAIVTFNWAPASSTVSYYFDVGNTQGSRDIYGNFATGGSTTVSGLPTDGRRIYVRLWTYISGAWQYNDYSYLTSGTTRAQITSPTNGSTFSSSTVTFNWGPVSNSVSYYLELDSSLGSRDIFANFVTGGSTTVSGVPTDGRTVYVRLWSYIGGVWVYNDYNYKAASSAAKAAITSPANGSTFPSSTVTFNWGPFSNSISYYLELDSSLGSRDIFANFVSGGSTTVSGVPTDGRTVYVRMWSFIGGVWVFNDYSYKASSSGGPAQISSPANGSTFGATAVTFNWNTVANASQYYLDVNSSPGSRDIFANYVSGGSTTVFAIPNDGRTIYVRLWSLISGVWYFNTYTYKACSGCVPVNTSISQITSPANGSTFGSSTVTFTWNGVAGASQYYLDVNSSPGSRDIFANYVTGGATSVFGIPIDGRTIYVRMWTNIGGVWYYNSYSYKAKG